MNSTTFTYNDIPYKIQHSLGALLIFIVSFPIIKRIPWRHLDLIFATTLPIMYFAGRELRDLEKSGYIDYWGFLAPTILSIALGGICKIFITNRG